MTDADIAQARMLLSALHEQVREMTPKLSRAERTAGCGGHTTRTRAMRQHAADLRRDIGRAQFLIAQIHRRFPEIETVAPAVAQQAVVRSAG